MPTTQQVPSTEDEILAAVHALEPGIRAAADTIEAERRLPTPLARALAEAGVFRMGVPRAYGGSELDPMAQVRVVEELSRIEGSIGWLSMISSAGSFIAAFLEPDAARRFFADTYSVMAGQLRPPQRADIVDGGYRVNGTFHFASGCQHATVMTCGCTLYEGGAPRLRHGHPEFRVMLVPTSKVTIIDVWNTTGMRGTGSNDFRVDNVFVPFDESPDMAAPPRYHAPLYTFMPLFLVSHAGVPLGIARSALDFVIDLGAHKQMLPSRRLLGEDAAVEETLAYCEATLGAARAYVYRTLENLWETLCKGGKPSLRQRAEYRMMITYSHQAAKQVISTLYDTAATSSIFRVNPLDRNLRDIVTACQHRVVHIRMYRPAGRLLFGLEPEELFF